MIKESLTECLRALPMLCQGRIERLRGWLEHPTGRRLAACAAAIVAGCACYGFTLGFWRAPEMGLFVAFKLPLLIALTLLTNGLINGMLAMVLGSGLTFRQPLHFCLPQWAGNPPENGDRTAPVSAGPHQSDAGRLRAGGLGFQPKLGLSPLHGICDDPDLERLPVFRLEAAFPAGPRSGNGAQPGPPAVDGDLCAGYFSDELCAAPIAGPCE